MPNLSNQDKLNHLSEKIRILRLDLFDLELKNYTESDSNYDEWQANIAAKQAEIDALEATYVELEG